MSIFFFWKLDLYGCFQMIGASNQQNFYLFFKFFFAEQAKGMLRCKSLTDGSMDNS